LKGGNLKKTNKDIITALACFISLILAIIISSCCEDCPVGPTQPEPYNGWLYATDYWYGWIYQIDIENDSVVDSTKHEGSELWGVGAMDVSRDGRYLAVNYISDVQKKTRIFDAQTLDLLTEIDHGMRPVFVESENLLIALTHEGIRLYSLPGFTLIEEDLLGFMADWVLCEDEGLLYIQSMLKPESSDSQFLVLYDLVTRQVDDTLIISDSLGNWFKLTNFDINSSADKLYFQGFSDEVPSSLNCYDLINRRFLFRKSVYSTHGDIKLAPSESEFYVIDRGWPTSYFSPGTVFIYDAESCEYLTGISLYGYTEGEDSDFPLYANSLAFTPDGRKCYVATGDIFRVDGCILIVDAQGHQSVDLIWPKLEHYILNLAIGPKPN
jgi:hypothetical protein